ncbi:hypothetical protein LK994_06530 [Ferruginibacter lapsinanis]|uniref:hypothetical protein n=1 Tax=Ferruginibacter lapsinanis TaxID=563172 RepID=UPI001E4F91E4|nr:hypothetical protein [Ferruginibacter lapsinanis]UEG51128.1 hypothetical protein LK994_06530 [Ferruginibacter lapsinanis]
MTFLSLIYLSNNKGVAGSKTVTIMDDSYSSAEGLRDGSGSPDPNVSWERTTSEQPLPMPVIGIRRTAPGIVLWIIQSPIPPQLWETIGVS